MVAIVVAICVGLLAVGLVGLLVAFSVIVLAGLKALNAVHEGGEWLVDRLHRRRTR